MVKYKNVNEQDIKTIKALADAGVKTSQIVKVTGRGFGTVVRAKQSKDLADYKRQQREYVAKHGNKVGRPAKVEGKPELVGKTPAQVTLVPQSKDSFNDELLRTLKRIAIAQEKLVEAWEAHPKAKRGFLG